MKERGEQQVEGGQATTLVGGKRDKDEKVKNKPTEKENGFLDQTTNEELHKDVTVGTKDGAGSILGCNVEEDTCGGSCPISVTISLCTHKGLKY